MILETLKYFHTITLGKRIRVYKDYKNITYKNFTTGRVICWHLLLE